VRVRDCLRGQMFWVRYHFPLLFLGLRGHDGWWEKGDGCRFMINDCLDLIQYSDFDDNLFDVLG
jgi:hypothetical protein